MRFTLMSSVGAIPETLFSRLLGLSFFVTYSQRTKSAGAVPPVPPVPVGACADMLPQGQDAMDRIVKL